MKKPSSILYLGYFASFFKLFTLKKLKRNCNDYVMVAIYTGIAIFLQKSP